MDLQKISLCPCPWTSFRIFNPMQFYRCMIRVLCNFLHFTRLQLSLPEVRHQLNNWTLENPKYSIHIWPENFRFGVLVQIVDFRFGAVLCNFLNFIVSFVSSRSLSPSSIEELNNWNLRKSIHILSQNFWQLKFWCSCANCGFSICRSYMQLPRFYLTSIAYSRSWAPIWKLEH